MEAVTAPLRGVTELLSLFYWSTDESQSIPLF